MSGADRLIRRCEQLAIDRLAAHRRRRQASQQEDGSGTGGEMGGGGEAAHQINGLPHELRCN